MSNWQNRIIQNSHPTLTHDKLDAAFLAVITSGQIEANKGWAPDADGLIDCRIVECPDCKAPGMNTCWGYWAFECGAERMAGHSGQSEPCGRTPLPQEIDHD